ncbi:MAG: SIS domain-containing protein [Phycisphaerae bacterium]|jgi:D-sedoheptulose 7-phosphate isomerase
MSRQWANVLAEHGEVIANLATQGDVIERIIDALVGALRGGRRIYVFGNGGSAADAQHIAAEFIGRFKRNRAALPAVALTTDTSALTAISNDLSFEQCFSRQVEGLVQRGDVVWALSTSGNSPNILEALRVANERGAVVIGFTGAGGDKLAQMCTHALRVSHTSSDRIQEGHVLAYHYVCERVDEVFAGA